MGISLGCLLFKMDMCEVFSSFFLSDADVVHIGYVTERMDGGKVGFKVHVRIYVGVCDASGNVVNDQENRYVCM